MPRYWILAVHRLIGQAASILLRLLMLHNYGHIWVLWAGPLERRQAFPSGFLLTVETIFQRICKDDTRVLRSIIKF
jgi:hypothetical protein